MLPKDQEKLINNVHSRVIEYLNDIEIKPIKTGKEIKSEIDLSIGNSSDLNQIKLLFDSFIFCIYWVFTSFSIDSSFNLHV